ncbi:MAG TPA: DUF58 domain-containing protein [Gammaproteobacteria bacterium]|nr:DUF58 domain-containing protein [Gammaproteobacteria bacterium]
MSLSVRTYYFLGLTALLGGAGQWLGGPWQDLWRVPAALLILGMLLEWRLTGRVVFTAECSACEAIALGRPAVLGLQLQNFAASVLHIEASIALAPVFQPEAETGFVHHCSLPAYGSAVLSCRVHATGLGEYEAGRLYTRLRGRLGLAWWRREFAVGRKLRVIPDSLEAVDLYPGLARRGARPRRVQPGSEGGAELLQMRDYCPGDPMRLIDWKATARSGKPMVRVFSEEQQLELVLLIDAGRGSRLQTGRLDRLHHYINVAARLGEAALRNGDRVGLVSFADQPIETTSIGRGMPALIGIREHLERLRARNTESNPLLAALHLKTLLKHRGLVVFLTEISGADSAGQLIKAAALLSPKHSALIAGVMDEDIERMRCETTGSWLDAYRNYAAQEYMQAVRRSMLRLRRLGGHVVLAKASDLDAKVMQGYLNLRQERRV